MKPEDKRLPLIAARLWSLSAGLAVIWIVSGATPGMAQVSPAEVVGPDLKAAEAQYFPQLKQLSHSITQTKFPFSFFLSRYVGLDPAKQAEADSRGLEFVKFHDRIVLKVTGNYNAAYNADRLTQNERASHAFHDVIIPLVQLVTNQIPRDATCDAIGFEISYHSRTNTSNYDYEGKEILVIVFEKSDAIAFSQATDDSERQEILDHSEVYLNGAEYGLSLSGPEPQIVEGPGRSNSHKAADVDPSSARVADHPSPGHQINSRLLLGKSSPFSAEATVPDASLAAHSAPIKPGPESDNTAASGAMTIADVDKLQALYQPELDGLAKEEAAKFHFVDYAPPSFALFQKQIALQITLRNPARFDIERTSIYKRAAQSFDLFLAPQLKDLFEKTPTKAEFASFDFTIMNQLAAEPHASSEAAEFVIPFKVLRQFVDAEITNQQLIDQSVVLVNGVRIALNLQLVE
jgi:hypothetical protein